MHTKDLLVDAIIDYIEYEQEILDKIEADNSYGYMKVLNIDQGTWYKNNMGENSHDPKRVRISTRGYQNVKQDPIMNTTAKKTETPEDVVQKASATDSTKATRDQFAEAMAEAFQKGKDFAQAEAAAEGIQKAAKEQAAKETKAEAKGLWNAFKMSVAEHRAKIAFVAGAASLYAAQAGVQMYRDRSHSVNDQPTDGSVTL